MAGSPCCSATVQPRANCRATCTWRAARVVFDAAVERAYGGRRKIAWYEVFAGEKAHREFGDWLPAGTLDAIRAFRIAIKGPLTTPVGGGIQQAPTICGQTRSCWRVWGWGLPCCWGPISWGA